VVSKPIVGTAAMRGVWRRGHHTLSSDVAYAHIYGRDRRQCGSPLCVRQDVAVPVLVALVSMVCVDAGGNPPVLPPALAVTNQAVQPDRAARPQPSRMPRCPALVICPIPIVI